MPLQAPKRLAAGGYSLILNPPIQTPSLKTTGTAWIPTDEWLGWADNQRKQLLGELLSHGNWFSRPPRHDVIEPLFAPWVGKNMKGELQFFGTLPSAAGPGTATLSLESLTMTTTAITPVWSVHEFIPEPEEDKISLFGDDDDGKSETREIQIEDIEQASPAQRQAPTFHIRNREWEAKKFLAKERVRESRLKAQVAEHMARKEESRFYALYGDLEDGESNFSEYDLSESEGATSDSENSESPSKL
jgi:hypothetical protein